MRVKKVTTITIIICLMIGLTGVFVQAFSSESLGKWSNELFEISEEQTNNELATAYESWSEQMKQQKLDAQLTYEKAMEKNVVVSSEEAKKEINQYLTLYKVDIQNIKKGLSHSFHTYEGEKKEELKSEMDQEIRLFLEETLEK